MLSFVAVGFGLDVGSAALLMSQLHSGVKAGTDLQVNIVIHKYYWIDIIAQVSDILKTSQMQQ